MQWFAVLPLNAIRHSSALYHDWMDNAWPCMRNQAGWGTEAGGAKGREEEGEGDDDARSWSLAGGGGVSGGGAAAHVYLDGQGKSPEQPPQL